MVAHLNSREGLNSAAHTLAAELTVRRAFASSPPGAARSPTLDHLDSGH